MAGSDALNSEQARAHKRFYLVNSDVLSFFFLSL